MSPSSGTLNSSGARFSYGRRNRFGLWMIVVAAVVLVIVAVLGIRGLFGAVSENRAEEQAELEEPLPPEPVTPTLSFEGFNVGRIIENEQFFDKDAYDQSQIQSFLLKWNEGCRRGEDGTPCITEYTEDTDSYPGDEYCSGFEGEAGDTVASIIWKSAQSCGINPQVLLTTLQKEQGLITASSHRLNETRYTIAMGYACPDSANCDPEYFGVGSQIYHAARQFRVYEVNPEMFMVDAERQDFIPYGPGEECGGSEVYVENQATANLYNYTPYQPDEPALNGALGPCSSVGNLYFYAYFNAWFGTPELAAESADLVNEAAQS